MAEDTGSSSAASKVQEAAANIHQSGRTRITRTPASEPETVARAYFEAINARELDAAVAMWADGGRENVRGQVDVIAPEGVRAFIGDLLGALPDLRFEIVSTTTEGERCGVQWRLTGTFAGPGTINGVAPTGHPIALEGLDLLSVRDGLIQGNEAFTDTMTFPRQIGMMPPLGSGAEQRMMAAFNLKTRLTGPSEAKLVAEGVWVVQGQPGRCNVYLIEDPPSHPAKGHTPKGAGRRGRRGDAVRCGRAHDGAHGRERRREARGHPPRGARPRAHRPPRHRPRAGRARVVPPR